MFLRVIIFLVLFYEVHSDYVFAFGPEHSDTEIPGTESRSSKISLDPQFIYCGKTYENAIVRGDGMIELKAENDSSSFRKSIEALGNGISISWNKWTGSVSYRHVGRSFLGRSDLTKAKKELVSDFTKIDDLKWAIIATWNGVLLEAHSSESYQNIFQLIITTDGQHSFALLYYYKTVPFVSLPPGFVGCGEDNPQHPSWGPSRIYFDKSVDYDIGLLVNRSNVDVPGKYVFQLHLGTVHGPHETTTAIPSTSTQSAGPCHARPVIKNGECEENFYRAGETAICNCSIDYHRVNYKANVRCVLSDSGTYVWKEENVCDDSLCVPDDYDNYATKQYMNIDTMSFAFFVVYYLFN